MEKLAAMDYIKDYLSRLAHSERDAWKRWDSLARAELVLALVGVLVGVATFAWLAITALAENEVCYGMSATKVQCQPVDALAAGRFVLVLSNILIPLLVALLAVRWQLHTTDPSARGVAYWTMFTCVLFVVCGAVLPAMTGAGFFLLPMAILMAAAATLGFVVWWQARKDPSQQAALEIAGGKRQEPERATK